LTGQSVHHAGRAWDDALVRAPPPGAPGHARGSPTVTASTSRSSCPTAPDIARRPVRADRAGRRGRARDHGDAAPRRL